MKKLMKKIEDIMAAVVFAEAGEFETAREILKERQKVLLTLTGKDSDKKSFKYALNICKRINAGIEILYMSKTDEMLNRFTEELRHEGIEHHVTRKEGCIKEEIIELAKKMRDINFVIVDSSEGLETECEQTDKTLSKTWEGLRCPLVVVMDGSQA